MEVSSNFLSELYCATKYVEMETGVTWSFDRVLKPNEIQMCEMTGFGHQVCGNESVISLHGQKEVNISKEELDRQVDSLNRHHPIYHMSRERFTVIMKEVISLHQEWSKCCDLFEEQIGLDIMGSNITEIMDKQKDLIFGMIKDSFGYQSGCIEILGELYDNDCPLSTFIFETSREIIDKDISDMYDYFLLEFQKQKDGNLLPA